MIYLSRSIDDYFISEDEVLEADVRPSVVESQNWNNHFATRFTVKSVNELVTRLDVDAGLTFLIPKPYQRPWTPLVGYAYVYE